MHFLPKRELLPLKLPNHKSLHWRRIYFTRHKRPHYSTKWKASLIYHGARKKSHREAIQCLQEEYLAIRSNTTLYFTHIPFRKHPVLIKINVRNYIESKPKPTYKFMLHPGNIHPNSPQSYANLWLYSMNLCTTCSSDGLCQLRSHISSAVCWFQALNNSNEHQLIRAAA